MKGTTLKSLKKASNKLTTSGRIIAMWMKLKEINNSNKLYLNFKVNCGTDQ